MIRMAAQELSESHEISLQKISRPSRLSRSEVEALRSTKDFFESMADKFWIYESPSIEDTYSLIMQHKPDVFIVDYLQAMIYKRPPGDDTYRTIINNFMVNVKDLSLMYKNRGVILSQLRRPSDANKPTRPKLTEMMESSSIENHSDLVLLVYWPGKQDVELTNEKHYGRTKNLRQAVLEILERKAPSASRNPEYVDGCYYEVIIDKNRNGATPIIPCAIVPYTTEMYDTIIVEPEFLANHRSHEIGPVHVEDSSDPQLSPDEEEARLFGME